MYEIFTSVCWQLLLFTRCGCVLVWLMIALQNAVNDCSELKKATPAGCVLTTGCRSNQIIKNAWVTWKWQFFVRYFLPLKTRQFLHGRTSYYRTVDWCVCEFNAVLHANFESDSDFFYSSISYIRWKVTAQWHNRFFLVGFQQHTALRTTALHTMNDRRWR